MNSKTNVQSNPGDILKWIVATLLTSAGIFANYYYHEIAWPLRLAGWIVLAIIVLFVALQTTRGKKFQVFAKEARTELRKVEWPNRQETMRFTMFVVIMVVIMSLVLWLIDTILLWVIKWFTG